MGKGTKSIYNLHITGHELLPPPDEIKAEFNLVGDALTTVKEGHKSVKGILDRDDPRLIVVVGPCSIHNPEEALEYARRLKPLADELSNELLILMRVYFEKPRTSVGWEGLIYDPYLDGSHRIDHVDDANQVFVRVGCFVRAQPERGESLQVVQVDIGHMTGAGTRKTGAKPN